MPELGGGGGGGGGETEGVAVLPFNSGGGKRAEIMPFFNEIYCSEINYNYFGSLTSWFCLHFLKCRTDASGIRL